MLTEGPGKQINASYLKEVTQKAVEKINLEKSIRYQKILFTILQDCEKKAEEGKNRTFWPYSGRKDFDDLTIDEKNKIWTELRNLGFTLLDNPADPGVPHDIVWT